MLVQWVTDDGQLHHAKRQLSTRGKIVALHMQVGTLGEMGWDWNVWEASGLLQQRGGLVATFGEAKAKAEGALGGLARELVLAA